MKKTNNFEKFLPKKKNSAIKEEFRQQKRKEKKARAEAIEERKAAKRAEQRGQPTTGRNKGEGFRTKPQGTKFRDQGTGSKPTGARTRPEDSPQKPEGFRSKTQGTKFRDQGTGSKPTGARTRADESPQKPEGFRSKPQGTKFMDQGTGSKPTGAKFKTDISSEKGAGARSKVPARYAVGPTLKSKGASLPAKAPGFKPGDTGMKPPATPAKSKSISLKPKEEMPLNKYIAHCGVCSRRDAAELVKEGKIKVNGTVVTEPGFKVSTEDEVTLSNKKIYLAHNLVYILLNKPKDYITTAEDPQGRKTVLELVRGATAERIFPVGRLDRNTTGVLLLTNDGELTQKLSHPSYEVRKMYEVKLDKPLGKADFDKILKGIVLEDGLVQVDALAYADTKDKAVIGIELHSGRNRIVRRIFEALGYDVRNLDRVMFANLTKKNVERGKWRFLKDKEVRLLKFMNSSFIRKQKKTDA
ncbi:MAG: rRNA pseudouridine synthase [Chitinophagaceae bacterium]|nr:rRNA pseudouridine synthase [Chitinophagaceae bacterium]